jgi:chorismate synthase
MKNTFGNSLSLTLWGESHGASIGAVLDGLAPGIKVDPEYIAEKLTLRRPVGKISTPRQESDPVFFESGVFNGYTTGTPLTIRIPNSDTHSKDYSDTRFLARPSHADFVASEKYHGFEDYRGGGHFSGRITAALVAAGAVTMSALEENDIYIGTHIKRCAGISDSDFSEDIYGDIKLLSTKAFATLSDDAGLEMQQKISDAREDCDSVGGILETAVTGIPTGLGEPWFDSVESLISHAIFSIPAVKGIEFGKGFDIAELRGSQANDPFRQENGRIVTSSNNSGGINGGITNGMPIIFRTAIRPTPTIAKEQETVNLETGENTTLTAKGRHDPCIVHRARVVQDCVTALVVYDLMATRFGTDWAVKI